MRYRKKNKDHQTFSHTKTRLRYHLIFSTKYRRKCLKNLQQEIIGVFREIENKSDFKILTMNLESDHIHFLLKFKPSLSIFQVVKRLKQWSTYLMWEKYADELSKYYWGDKKKLWSSGYFCSTIGEVSEKNIIEYIKKQG